MPSVPKLNSPRISEQALPQIRVPTNQPLEAFGGGAALERRMESEQKLAESILDPIEKIAMAEKKKADKVKSGKAKNDLAKEKTRLFWDTKEGAITRRGENAFGATDEYLKRFDDFAKKLEDSLSNDDQKEDFKSSMFQDRESFYNQLTQHTYNEYQKYQEELVGSRIENSKNDAVLNYTNPSEITKNINRQKEVIFEHAKDNGKDAEYVRLETEKAISNTHTAIIDRMLANGQDKFAKDYYELHKNEFNKNDIASVEKVVNEGSKRGEARRFVDDLFKKNPNIDMKKAVKMAEGIENTDIYDETIKRIKFVYDLKEEEDKQLHESLFKNASYNLEVNKGDMSKIPEKLLLSLTIQERNTLEERSKRIRQGNNVTNLTVYYDLVSLASSPDTQNAFMKKSMEYHINDLSTEDYKKIVELQASLRTKDGKANDELDSIRTRKDIVNEALETSGVNVKKNKDKVSVFRKQVDDEIAAHYRATGKKATTEDTQKIVDRLKVKALVKDGGWLWFDKEKELWQVEEGEEISISVKDLPKSDVREIEELLRKNKRAVNDDNILKVYNNVYGKGRKK